MTTLCSYTLLLIVITIIEMRAPLSTALCGLSEFSCDNGKCVRQNMYCNGREDCGDGSDEPRGCIACNRTFNGEANIKYRLHISEPFHRHVPFLCVVSFVADGGEYGDYVELRFLSFNVGSLEKGSSGLTCYGGHLQVLDKKNPETDISHQQTRGLSQLVSALKHTNGMFPSLYNFTGKSAPHFGYFCGQMTAQGANYFSSGNNVTLLIFMPRRTSWRYQSFNVFLTYRFITSKTSVWFQKDETKVNVGRTTPNSFCNVEYRDCVNRVCIIRSPNFPGTFLPNFTCQYLIRQNEIPKGFHAQIVLKQDNEYKISIENGHSGLGAISSSSLTTDCSRNVVRIFDGSTPDTILLTEFCGSGALPKVVSSQSSVLIQLISAPSQLLHDSRLELEARVRFVKKPVWRISGNSCNFLIDGSRGSEGIIENPQHTVPLQTTCTYIIRGKRPSDRVWLYFTSYIVEDKHPWSLTEHCDTGKLQILGLAVPDHLIFTGNNSFENNHTYCEKSFPQLCTRAGDSRSLMPLRPCSLPEESYFSKGPELMLKLNYPRISGIPTMQPIFKARYEIVDTRQPGLALELSLCDRFVGSENSDHGTIFSPRNVLYYGRGGRREISCRYDLKGRDSKRVKITFLTLQLLSSLCTNAIDSVTRQRTCEINHKHKGPLSFIQLVENWQGIELSLGCFCNISLISLAHKPIEITSLSDNVSVIFTVKGMTSVQDYRHFNFRANYKFFSFPPCDYVVKKDKGSKGILTMAVTRSVIKKHGEFRCRWSLKQAVGKHTHLTFRGTKGLGECPYNNIVKVYVGSSKKTVSTVCLNENVTEVKVVSPILNGMDSVMSHHTNLVSQGKINHIILEAIIRVPQPVRIEWGEVTKPFLKKNVGQSLRTINCLVRCPEINACISPDLWCDGKKHCPSGYDEAAEHCERYPLLYVAVGIGVTLFLLVLVLIVIIVRCRNRDKRTIRIPAVDHFEMNGSGRAQEDCILKY
ncbi:uncharacterized protein LOC143222678 [Tachypleus tridentatus]|uniref:uncharacterized protein LOC143222678 n=1 Tax=Tachypleus tridentatus TaxID=6853 RepID=UPI003FCEEC68